jgi:uncharacterized protein
MTKKQIINKTEKYIKNLLSGETTGHDYFHIERVVKNAKNVARYEGGDLFIIEMAALLHDIADWKFHQDDENISQNKIKEWLLSLKVSEKETQNIFDIVKHISYKGGTNKVRMNSIEGKIVQDADRLDALGAIGIARAFAYGGYSGREIYNPSVKAREYKSFNQFKNSLYKNTSINHFYEKLLLLKDKMNTKTGKKMAIKRHNFIKKYLKQFFYEWKGQAEY